MCQTLMGSFIDHFNSPNGTMGPVGGCLCVFLAGITSTASNSACELLLQMSHIPWSDSLSVYWARWWLVSLAKTDKLSFAD